MIKYNDLWGIKRLFLILLFVFLFLSVSSKSVFALELGSSDDDVNTVLENTVLHLESIYNGYSECDGLWCDLYDKYKIMRDEPFKYYTYTSINEASSIINVYISSSSNPFKYSSKYGVNKLYVDKKSSVSELKFRLNLNNGSYYLYKVDDLLFFENHTGFFNGSVNSITDIVWSNHNIYDLNDNLIYKFRYDLNDYLYSVQFLFNGLLSLLSDLIIFTINNPLLLIDFIISILILIIIIFKKLKGV